MIIRIAKQADRKSLANIHMECGKAQINGFMHKLGELFLRTYYYVLLKEKNALVLIAEDENGYGIGFHSGTTKAEEHLVNMRNNKIILAISLIPAIIKNPKLIKDIVLRNNYVSSESNLSSYGAKTGPRAEYWAWRPSNNRSTGAIVLRTTWSNIMFDLGCKSFKLEVDLSNTDISKYSKAFSCTVLEEKTLPDGRKRVIMEQNIIKRSNAFKKKLTNL
jgi:hypothetical protein